MDSANKQDGVIAEVTKGTTPSSPAFLLGRFTNITGSPQRNSFRSPERRPDRMMASMVTGLNGFQKTVSGVWSRDAAYDLFLESLLNGAWSTNVLKNASTVKSFTLEEKYEGGATDPYRRATGCQIDSLAMSYRIGEAIQCNWAIRHMGESVGTTAIASSSYTAPSPGYDPVSTVDIAVTSMFGISSPKVVGLDMTITNNMAPLYAFGSANPIDNSLGLFDISGSLQLYLNTSTDYSTFTTRQTGLTFNITLGSVTNFKDKIEMGNVHAFNPDISDPGATGQHIVTIPFSAAYYASDTSAIKWTRLVA